MERLLVVTSSPHIKSRVTTHSIMLDVLIALVPGLAASVWLFGPRSLLVVGISVVSCVFFEWITQKISKRPVTIGDLSACVTGTLLAFSLPVSVPLWILPIGAAFAIIFVKQLFGGIGQNFANPAITARIVITLSFASLVTKWTAPFEWLGKAADGVTSATPLVSDQTLSFTDMLLGVHGGCLGETCAAALILGGIYLVIKRVISPVIPLSYIGSAVLLGWLFGTDPVTALFGGGLMLGAIFMATDYATSPDTPLGKFIFGLGCGLITALIRRFGAYPEGVSFSILLMNILTPLIDRYVKTRPLGAAEHEK